MALTDDQKKNLLIGGGVGAATLLTFWLFGGRKAGAAPAHAPDAPGQQSFPAPGQRPVSMRGPEPHTRKKRHDRDDNDERGRRGERGERGRRERGRGRGEYGRNKHKSHHHAAADVFVGQRPPQQWHDVVEIEERPDASIWRLNERIDAFVYEFGNVMSGSQQLWAKLHPVWERDVLPFLGEWGPFWRESNRWSWSEFNRWATRWNAIVARLTLLLPSKEPSRGA